MDIKIGEVLKATQGEALGPVAENCPIHKVSTDTRTLEKEDLFFALRGERFDGHHFLKEAFEKGARNFVISEAGHVPADCKKSANFIRVPDTLRAYGDTARFYRQKFRIPAVAITGSSGKTTVKEMIAIFCRRNSKS